MTYTQLTLFEVTLPRRECGLLLADQVAQLARDLSPAHLIVFGEILTETAKHLRYVAELESDCIASSIIAAINKSCAHTLDEIAEDVGVSHREARTALGQLIEANEVIIELRSMVGLGRPTPLYFSQNKACRCSLR